MKVDKDGKLVAESAVDKMALRESIVEIEGVEAAEESLGRQSAILGLRYKLALAIIGRMLSKMDKKRTVMYDHQKGAFYQIYEEEKK